MKEILFTLSEDPDPGEERERPPEGHAGFNKPLHIAINSTRPIGIEALLLFALKLAECDGYQGFSNEGESGFDGTDGIKPAKSPAREQGTGVAKGRELDSAGHSLLLEKVL